MNENHTDQPRRVLIIDDDEGFVSLVRHLLTARGHHVSSAADGFEALDMLAHAELDVAIVDYVLPKIDGDELCRVIRSMARHARARLVLVSAAALEAELDVEPGLIDICIAKDSFPRMAPHLVRAVEDESLPVADAALTVHADEQVAPRRIARELFGRKRHLELILDSIDEGIVEFDHGRVVYASRGACRLLESEHAALLNRNEGDLLGDLRPLSGGVGSRQDSRGVIDVGSRVLHVRAIEVEADASRIVVLADVTEQDRLQGRLRRAEKMESVGVMASGVAHNFNNLLQGILGSAAMLELTEGISSGGKELLRNITVCCRRGADLTRRLLEFARTHPERREVTRPADVVLRAIRMLEQGRQDVSVSYDLPSELPSIEIDPLQIEEVLIALLMNAAQSMELGGEIIVSADLRIIGPDSPLTAAVAEGSYVAISVEDRGGGIPPELRERVFDPFFTTGDYDERVGLGLASAFGIVTGHGGTIDFETRMGSGTTFTLLLPAGPVMAVADDAADGGEHDERAHTVLLVDDDPLILRSCRTLLEHLGFRVITADSGARALEAFRNLETSIAIAILDVAMPDMNGWEVAERLRARAPDLPVVFTSGYRLEGLPQERRAQVRHFLAKPFSLAALDAAVSAALGDRNDGSDDG